MSCQTNCPFANDSESLYDNRIYDRQENSIRCYENNPVKIVEGFDTSFTRRNIIKWILILLVVLLAAYIVYCYCCSGKKMISVDYPTANYGNSSPPITMD